MGDKVVYYFLGLTHNKKNPPLVAQRRPQNIVIWGPNSKSSIVNSKLKSPCPSLFCSYTLTPPSVTLVSNKNFSYNFPVSLA
jgi:hypothetical protein